MRIDILTLFPELFDRFRRTSIVGRAVSSGAVQIELTNIRDFAQDKHRSVDDRPFGGGPGMVLMCEPVFDAVAHVGEKIGARPEIVMLTPQGERLNQGIVRDLAALPNLILLCGHYEGFDERIRAGLRPREISIGDYVLSGGELPAMVLAEAVTRLQPGALGHPESCVTESFSDGLLEYPQYTRPRSFRQMDVPEVLLNGHHAEVAAWRQEQSIARTRTRRPDLVGQDSKK